MMDKANEGGCLCGAIRYAFSGVPLWTGYCHCASCRRNTGAVVACFVGLRPQQLEWTSGQCREFESSADVWRGFCGDCGTPISYRARRWPNEIHLYVGTLDHPEQHPPRFHVFYNDKMHWFDSADDLPRHAQTALE